MPMTPEAWTRVKALFHSALEHAPHERAALVDRAAAGDTELRDEVMSLIAVADDGISQVRATIAAAAIATSTMLDEADGAERRVRHDRLVDALQDRYAIEREVGRGGTATVFLARDLRHDRQVALKVLRAEFAAALGTVRFLAEIKTTARIQHPNILPLLDSGEAAGLPFYAMPYVAGGSLRLRIVQERQLPVDEAVRIVSEIARALDHAHAMGVLHRDVKPENILLSDGRPLLADFGIARTVAATGDSLTMTGFIIGTPAYMAPEQAGAEASLDGRSDQYALACVLYELLTGQRPYGGPTTQSVLLQHLGAAVPSPRVLRPSVSPALAAVVQRAMAKRPVDRFATGAQFARALERATAPGATPRWWTPVATSRRARIRLLVGVGLAGVAATAAWNVTGNDSGPQLGGYRLREPEAARRSAFNAPSFDARPILGVNVAAGMPSFQSSTHDPLDPAVLTGAFKANDGNLCAFFSCGGTQHTDLETNAWWYVDLRQTTPLRAIRVYNIRTIGPTGRLFPSTVSVHADGQADFTKFGAPSIWSTELATQPNPDPLVYDIALPSGTRGRYVKVQLNGMNWLHMAEVEVYR